MTEAIKQIKIKTSAVGRLKKQYLLYVQEIKSKKQKIIDLPSVTEGDLAKIKRQNMFLDESESALSYVKQKLIEAFEDLDLFKQKSSIPEVETSNEKAKSVLILQQIELFLQEIQ